MALVTSTTLASPTGPAAPNGGVPGILARPPATPLYTWFSNSLPTLLIVAGGLLVVSVLVSRAKAAKAPKSPSLEERFARLVADRQPRPGDADAGLSAGSAVSNTNRPLRSRTTESGSPPPNPLDQVARDAEELAQHLAVAMDARAARLEALIREADDRLRRLDHARHSLPAHAGAAPTASPVPRADAAESALKEPRPADRSRALPVGASAPERPGVPSFDADRGDPVHRQVFDLADQGLPALDIARRLGQPTGQVELILALRGR